MNRFKRNFVGIDIENTFYNGFFCTNTYNGYQFVPLKGVTLDDNGRLVGKVVEYERKSHCYWVQFSPDGQRYLIRLRDCKDAARNDVLFPAHELKFKVKVVPERVKAKAWHHGVLREVYLSGKEVHGANAKIFVDQNDKLSVIKGRTFLDDRNILYFLES